MSYDYAWIRNIYLQTAIVDFIGIAYKYICYIFQFSRLIRSSFSTQSDALEFNAMTLRYF